MSNWTPMVHIELLDGLGFVELLDYMADDIDPVNGARVSFQRVSKKLTEKDVTLLRRLMNEGHGSPFEHAVFRFRVKAPLFIVAQWERHRMASYNQQSGRYSEFDAEFYAPEPEIEEGSKNAYYLYKLMLGRGVPRERARIVLPVGQMTTFVWTVNARSLLNFVAQRNEAHAQEEMQDYAKAVEECLFNVIPQTMWAFVDYDRVAP